MSVNDSRAAIAAREKEPATIELARAWLKRPYGRLFRPEPDGRFTATILEFEFFGVRAEGATLAEAAANLEQAFEMFLIRSAAVGYDPGAPCDAASFRFREP